MGNKADVVKGLAKRCNENWSVAPKSDIVSCRLSYGGNRPSNPVCKQQGLYLSDIQVSLSAVYAFLPRVIFIEYYRAGPFNHHDAKLESL
jgi:hypothetical protein